MTIAVQGFFKRSITETIGNKYRVCVHACVLSSLCYMSDGEER